MKLKLNKNTQIDTDYLLPGIDTEHILLGIAIGVVMLLLILMFSTPTPR